MSIISVPNGQNCPSGPGTYGQERVIRDEDFGKKKFIFWFKNSLDDFFMDGCIDDGLF